MANVAAAENDGFVDFRVMLSAPSASNVSVNFSNANATATNGADYVATSGTLRFAPGETVKTFRLGLINDAAAEALENFSFNLAGLLMLIHLI